MKQNLVYPTLVDNGWDIWWPFLIGVEQAFLTIASVLALIQCISPAAIECGEKR
jgi:hypothetical protein